MKKLLELYYNHVERSFQPGSYPKDLYELLFLGQLNSYALQFNPIIIGPNNVKHPMSLIALALSGSGSGKDSAVKFLEPLKEEVDKIFNNVFNAKRDFVLLQDEDAEDVTPQGPHNMTVAKPKSSRKKPLKETLAVEHIPWVKSATDAGMNMYFETYSMLGFGSIGLASTEFGQDFKDKQFRDTLEKVLELWDNPSKVASRITNEKGAIVFEGVQSSCVMHGAFDEFKKNDKMIEDLQVYLSTTMARRGLFVKISDDDNLHYFKCKVEANKLKLVKMKAEKMTDAERQSAADVSTTTEFMTELIDRISTKVLKVHGDTFIGSNVLNDNGNIIRPEILIRMSRGAELLLHFYQTEMEQRALEIAEGTKVSDRRLVIELGSRHLKAMRIAGMSAFYNGRDIISEDDVKFGVKVAHKSGVYFEEISKPSIIVDDVCAFLMKTTEKATVRNLEESEIIPAGMTKYKLQDLFERCAEELYQKNMIFRSTIGKANMIQQTWIERLVDTEGDKAHISYSTNEHMADVYMETMSCPLDQILLIPNIKKMGAGGFKNNSRSINNIEALGNVLIYDIDNGEMTIEQCKDTFRGMKGFIYPTKSHMKAKRTKTGKKTPDGADIVEEKVCHRFRIVLLCKQHFPFGEDKSQANEEYKLLYAEIAKHFGIPFDENAMDSSRFYWIPEEAKTEKVRSYGKFEGNNMIDLTHFMPNLKIHNEIKAKSQVFDSQKYWANMSVRDVLERCLKDAIIKGSRNCAMFSMAMSLMDKGLDYDTIEEHVLDVNDKFDNGPIEEGEVKRSILTSLKKRMDKK